MSQLPRVSMGATGAVAVFVYASATPALAADPGFPNDNSSGSGFDGIFIFFAVVVIVGGIAGTLWKVNMARTMAKRSGMDPDTATKMTLYTRDGLDATYLASSLRQPPHPPAADTDTHTNARQLASATDRLTELKSLLDQGLVTQDEYESRRKAIIDAL